MLSSLNNDSGEKGNGKTADSQNKKTSGTNEKALNEKLAYYTGGYGTKLLSKQVMPSNLSYKAVSLANQSTRVRFNPAKHRKNIAELL